MKNLWKNYKSTLILLLAILLGAAVGLIWGEGATALKPFGDVFINLMLVTIVPLIFLTITASIIQMDSPRRLGKIMSRIVLVFVLMSLVAVLVGLGATHITPLVNTGDTASLEGLFDQAATLDTELSILERTAALVTVGDFSQLLSHQNIIAIFLFAILFGLAVRQAGEKAAGVKAAIVGLNAVILKLIGLIMHYAPIGLGCYFAALIATYGQSIAYGFLKTFVIYTLACVFVYGVVYSIYALLAGGRRGLIRYWQSILPPTATALATCSSAASIPVNVQAAKNAGVPSDIAEAAIPMGTSFHKEGSVIGSVFKIMFLAHLFGQSPSLWTVMGVALVATLLISAVPVGGGTISEMMILSLMGFPAAALPILTIIATVIDAPATVLNVVGDTASSMLVARCVDGKGWQGEATPRAAELQAQAVRG